MLVTPEYKEILEKEHKRDRAWGSTGASKAGKIVRLASAKGIKSILDYGCGKGALKAHMSQQHPEYIISEYDPGIPGKDTPPEPTDMVVCVDVLEHIEHECVDAVIDDLKRLTVKLLMVDICSHPAGKILLDGRNAHLIQEHGDWWVEKFSKYFDFEAKAAFPGGLYAAMIPKK